MYLTYCCAWVYRGSSRQHWWLLGIQFKFTVQVQTTEKTWDRQAVFAIFFDQLGKEMWCSRLQPFWIDQNTKNLAKLSKESKRSSTFPLLDSFHWSLRCLDFRFNLLGTDSSINCGLPPDSNTSQRLEIRYQVSQPTCGNFQLNVQEKQTPRTKTQDLWAETDVCLDANKRNIFVI